MKVWLWKYRWELALGFFIALYISYFSVLSIERYKTLYASYFDLGIMHQTVFNTYKGLATGDFSRILELTNPFGPEQIVRMSIHNDILLAFMAPFYFIHSGPETLLVIQTIVLGIGAWFLYLIAQLVLRNKWLAFSFALVYLLYPSMQRANIYDFHAVTLTTSFLLIMFYAYMRGWYVVSFAFFLLNIFAKEQVALETTLFGMYVLYQTYKARKAKQKLSFTYPLAIIATSIIWFIVTMSLIIPHYRGDHHFALGYYGDFGDSPTKIVLGILKNPLSLSKYIFRNDTLMYFVYLLGPTGFLSLTAPITLLISAPDFMINLLSNNWNMRNIVFHYTSVIQPFTLISAIYGASVVRNMVQRRFKKFPIDVTMGLYILVCAFYMTATKGPLPFSREANVHPFLYPQPEAKQMKQWQQVLQSDSIRVSSTGQLAPFFTSRRYFYTFSSQYALADYIVLRRGEIYNYPEKDVLIPAYESLVKDQRFKLIYQQEGLEVYKKITTSL